MFSVFAAAELDWWHVYILIELLELHYTGRIGGRWTDAQRALSAHHRISCTALGYLRRTANYYRHARETMPPKPWELQNAVNFVHAAARVAARDYLAGYTLAPDVPWRRDAPDWPSVANALE